MADFDAYDVHLTEWGSEETGLFYSLGSFFIVYSWLERGVRALIMALCKVAPGEHESFAAKTFDRMSLKGLVVELKRLADERNVLAHDLVGAVEDINERPGFIVRGDEPKSVDTMQSLIEECIRLANRVWTLSSTVVADH